MPSLHLTNDVSNFGIVDLQQIHLTDERVFNLARQFEPLLTRPRAQIAERTDAPLARPLGGVDRLDQDVIGEVLTLVSARRPADVHSHYES